MHNPYSTQISELEEKIKANEQLLDDPELAELAKQELESLKAQKQVLEDAAAELTQDHPIGSDPSDTTQPNAILEIRGGAGGDEAKIWANDLLRMYARFVELVGLKFEYLDDMVVKFKGKVELAGEVFYPYELFKYESGVHRVQRVPATEAQGRIHTSTASVAVLPEIAQNA